MSDPIIIQNELSKKEKYENLIPQIESLINEERNVVANLANVAAVLKEAFGFFWVGFYLAENDELVLGPFQGPIACTRIGWGRGVCGAAWKDKKTILVSNVDEFPGHIACNAHSKSEIVVPIMHQGRVVGVLDIDSEHLSFFDDVDKIQLEELMKKVASIFN
jgi:GAF domain-containing protein